ncbi:MAG TPA: GntR family transcriptional regulator [Cytophagales bacterium]|nr:GntR family transcriptional regulator [Cytophagales bacterium]
MIEIGKFNELEILRHTSVGLYLGDNTGEDVLLPNKYCPENVEQGDKIRVFVYRDHEERKVATNLTPKIALNDFARLKVTATTNVGAFLDWGLEKDLMVPFNEQQHKMEEGQWYLVYLNIDKKTDRLYASSKIDKFLQNESLTVAVGDEVDIIVMQKTDLGYSVVVNKVHKGLVFENEIFKPIKVGDRLKGFVKKIREDNKIDISLQPIGYDKFNDPNCEIIQNKLLKSKGFIPITDNSSPEKIYAAFGMSKKAFKKAIGALYKQRKISITPEGIQSNQPA